VVVVVVTPPEVPPEEFDGVLKDCTNWLFSALGVPQTPFIQDPLEVYHDKSFALSIVLFSPLSPAGQFGFALTSSTKRQFLSKILISSLSFFIAPT
jgi:hypothetical protein